MWNGGRTQSLFAPEMWSVHQRTIEQRDRTNNYVESNHRRLQNAFKAARPTIWTFINTLRQEQRQTDANFALFVSGQDPPPKAKRYRDADRRILTLVNRYLDEQNHNHDHQYINQDFNPQKIIEFLSGISNNYQMNP